MSSVRHCVCVCGVLGVVSEWVSERGEECVEEWLGAEQIERRSLPSFLYVRRRSDVTRAECVKVRGLYGGCGWRVGGGVGSRESGVCVVCSVV